MASLELLPTFGEVAAEEDPVLQYFIETDFVRQVAAQNVFLVLGRKGAGKTAIVKYFSEGEVFRNNSIILNLRAYSWGIHAARADAGASPVEAFVASWRYVIAVQLAASIVRLSGTRHHDELRSLREFLDLNYGGPQPQLSQILQPPKLRLTSLKVGVKIAELALNRQPGDISFGLELDSVSNALLQASLEVYNTFFRGRHLYIHFDELDHGLELLNDERRRLLIGLIITARELQNTLKRNGVAVSITLYLRTDIWDSIQFTDQNKIQHSSAAVVLKWSRDELKALISRRLTVQLGEDVAWDDVEDGRSMRGSSKFDHIIARTLDRPRDVIHFLNEALKVAKKRGGSPLIFTNPDIVTAREGYSEYFKRELGEEISPHWENWEVALQTCSALYRQEFDRQRFENEYNRRVNVNEGVSAADALQKMFNYSIIGYERRARKWAFAYKGLRWDNGAKTFKVHPGLNEAAQIKEVRVARQ